MPPCHACERENANTIEDVPYKSDEEYDDCEVWKYVSSEVSGNDKKTCYMGMESGRGKKNGIYSGFKVCQP